MYIGGLSSTYVSMRIPILLWRCGAMPFMVPIP